MGGGRIALFPGTKGSDSQQITLFPDPISVHHRGPTYAIDGGDSEGVSVGGIGGGIHTKDRILLLTPPDVLRMCLRWRIGAVTEKRLLSWLQGKLNDKRYRMEPVGLRQVLDGFIAELKATRILGKGYNRDAFLSVIEKWEKSLESL